MAIACMGLETLKKHCEDVGPQYEGVKRSAGEENTVLGSHTDK